MTSGHLKKKKLRHYLPVMKHWHTKCLALGMCPQIGFKPKGINSWNESLDCVQRRSRYGSVLRHMASITNKTQVFHGKINKDEWNYIPSLGKNRVDCWHTVSWSLHLNEQVRFHEPWRSHEKGRIRDTPRSGYNLSAAPVQRLGRNNRIKNFELDITNLFFT